MTLQEAKDAAQQEQTGKNFDQEWGGEFTRIVEIMERAAELYLQSNLTPVSENSGGGSYVVFEHSQEQDGLVQLSVTLPTLERAREYVKAWKSKKLYIYLLVE